jgi:hypothetical protein
MPKVVTRGVDVIVNVFYKHSRIKEYLKEGRALRIETVCNSPTDLGCQRRLCHLPELQAKARAANRRLLTIQRAGQGCALATALFERVALPSFEEGQRTGALRFGDPRGFRCRLLGSRDGGVACCGGSRREATGRAQVGRPGCRPPRRRAAAGPAV